MRNLHTVLGNSCYEKAAWISKTFSHQNLILDLVFKNFFMNCKRLYEFLEVLSLDKFGIYQAT